MVGNGLVVAAMLLKDDDLACLEQMRIDLYAAFRTSHGDRIRLDGQASARPLSLAMRTGYACRSWVRDLQQILEHSCDPRQLRRWGILRPCGSVNGDQQLRRELFVRAFLAQRSRTMILWDGGRPHHSETPPHFTGGGGAPGKPPPT